uniref:Zf-3CxxC domain-containing protein n=1 Tax=Caenorhabditis tropicalis TaxID=1561998 RepID=A0A1I7T2Q2_9PELO
MTSSPTDLDPAEQFEPLPSVDTDYGRCALSNPIGGVFNEPSNLPVHYSAPGNFGNPGFLNGHMTFHDSGHPEETFPQFHGQWSDKSFNYPRNDNQGYGWYPNYSIEGYRLPGFITPYRPDYGSDQNSTRKVAEKNDDMQVTRFKISLNSITFECRECKEMCTRKHTRTFLCDGCFYRSPYFVPKESTVMTEKPCWQCGQSTKSYFYEVGDGKIECRRCHWKRTTPATVFHCVNCNVQTEKRFSKTNKNRRMLCKRCYSRENWHKYKKKKI